MPLWTAQEIADATNGTASGNFAVDGVAFDSREVTAGDLFIARKGEQSDGHKFLDMAFERGAGGAVVSEACEGPHVRVADTNAALDDLGRAGRNRTDAKVIGVTGSVGKTGTKEALFAALDRVSLGGAHRSVKSYNNHTGVPLSLSRMPADTRFGIFEMGMNHPGELSALTQLVRPHVAIVTTVAPAHAGFFDSEEQIADAKAEIFEGLEPEGVAIMPFDNPHYARLRAKAERHAARLVSFGFGDGADVRANEVLEAHGGGSEVIAKVHDRQLQFRISAPGRHWVSNALAVIAAVEATGADIANAALALGSLAEMPGRGARHDIATRDGGTALLIDESYNANPASMRATLQQFAREPAEGKILVLGAMGELGDKAPGYHAALAEDVMAVDARLIVFLGDEMRHCADALASGPEIHMASDAAGALAIVEAHLAGGDALLVKGSNYLGLAKLVAALTAEER